MTAQLVTYERLREVLHYNSETGAFTWKKRISIRIMVGQSADCLNGDGYLAIGIDGRKYKANRLAWLYMTGEHPIDEMDHINGIRTDNRWVNLRHVSRAVNTQNSRLPHRRKKTSPIGTSEQGGLWRARICVKGSTTNLGYFDTPESAHAAYVEAKRVHHPGGTL